MMRPIGLATLFLAAGTVAACSAAPTPSEATARQDDAITINHCPYIHYLCAAPTQNWCTFQNGCEFCPCAPTLDFAPLTGTADPYSIYISIGGASPVKVIFDTGSVGLFVSQSAVPASALTTEPCSITYASGSQNTVSGVVANAPIALFGASTTSQYSPAPTTATMPLCAVTQSGVGVMGVGFGQAAKAQTPTPGPTWNVMRQIQGIGEQGYVVGGTSGGVAAPWVQVGANGVGATSAGYQTMSLTASGGDWLPSSFTATIRVGSSFSQAGSLLVDTGIAEAIVWAPQSEASLIPSSGSKVLAGTSVSIASPVLDYSYDVGGSGPATVDVGVLNPTTNDPNPAPVYNTGNTLLSQYDYLFDATDGIVGFTPAN